MSNQHIFSGHHLSIDTDIQKLSIKDDSENVF